jgi:hypothetical protein
VGLYNKKAKNGINAIEEISDLFFHGFSIHLIANIRRDGGKEQLPFYSWNNNVLETLTRNFCGNNYFEKVRNLLLNSDLFDKHISGDRASGIIDSQTLIKYLDDIQEIFISLPRNIKFFENRYIMLSAYDSQTQKLIKLITGALKPLMLFQYLLIEPVSEGVPQRILSSGEMAFLTLMSKFLSNISDLDVMNPLILIDEGELGLHPQWQKQYLNILLEFLPKIFKNKNVQLILTTHSPFLVSDLPKENIIFLKRDKEGKCEVSDLKDHKATFGANIHTLFSDSFFMQGGLIGEFAKKKIDRVIALLQSDKELTEAEQKECEFIVSKIGEPIVQRELEKKLKAKRQNTELSELEKLRKENRELKEQLKNGGGNAGN